MVYFQGLLTLWGVISVEGSEGSLVSVELWRMLLLRGWWQIIAGHDHSRRENRCELPFTYTITVTLSGTVTKSNVITNILLFGSLWTHIHTHTHKLTNILYVCEFCQCHLKSAPGACVDSSPCKERTATQSWQITCSTGGPQGGSYSPGEGGGNLPTHSQVTALSFRRGGSFHYDRWFTFKPSQKRRLYSDTFSSLFLSSGRSRQTFDVLMSVFSPSAYSESPWINTRKVPRL